MAVGVGTEAGAEPRRRCRSPRRRRLRLPVRNCALSGNYGLWAPLLPLVTLPTEESDSP